MSEVDPVRGEMIEGEDVPPIVLRVTAPNGTALVPTDAVYGVDSWDLVIWDHYDEAQATIFSLTGQSSSSFFSSLQTPSVSGEAFDAIGFNFRHVLTQAALAAQSAVLRGGNSYGFRYQFNTTAQGILRAHLLLLVRSSP